MDDPIEGLLFVTIHIRDIKRTHEFYTKVLGLKALSYNEELQRAVFAIPGTTTALVAHVKGPDEGGREPGTVSGVTFAHHDPFAACAEIKKRGGTITDEPRIVERPGGITFTIGVFADPDGNEFVIRKPQ